MQPSYYATIPAPVRYDKTLPPAAKLLYGEITALCNAKGYCWAGNKYFAELYDVTTDSVSLWISKLQKAGYIRIDSGKDRGNERRIYLSEKFQIPIEKNLDSYLKEISELSEENQIAIRKNLEHNNTLNNKGNNKEIPVVPASAETDVDGVKIIGIGEVTARNVALYAADVADPIRLKFLSENKGRQFPNATEFNRAVRAFRDTNKTTIPRPTLEEIRTYMTEKGMASSEADNFFNFYESKGWYVGKNPMTKWKSAVATWRNNPIRGLKNTTVKPVSSSFQTKEGIPD